MRLHGRAGEAAAIDRLLDGAAGGRSGALVLRGEAGIGKTALLELAAARAAGKGMRVLRGTGIENETGMPYAGLHLLLGGELDRIDALPGPQAGALREVLGMGGGGDGDRFLAGLALLTLLADLAEERPLLCLVDDVQWLDSASAEVLLFAVRRLEAEPIAVLLAARDPDETEFVAPGLPELRLRGLDPAAAADLLAERAAELPRHERHEILAEAMGNPLALLELPAVSARTDSPSSRFQRIQGAFAARVAALPEPSRTALLVAAADGTGDLALIVPAAGRLGASVADLDPAERRGLVTSADGLLKFRHPLIRTAAYTAAPLSRRLAAHRALAEAHRELGDGCRYAWHLARSATGPDETVAAVLERAAGLDLGVGGNAVVSAMYERAAVLSPDPADRGRRLAVAARAAADGGLSEHAIALAERAEADTPDPVRRADLVLIRALLAEEGDRGREAYRLLSGIAGEVADQEPHLAGHLLFKAASAASKAGDVDALRRAAERAEELKLPNGHLPRALATMFLGQDPPAAGGDTAALNELITDMAGCLGTREVVETGWWRLLAGDLEGAERVAADVAQRCRDQGSAGLLSLALPLLARARLMLGRHAEALTAATEGMRIAGDIGQHRLRVYNATVLALLAAIAGEEERCAELAGEALRRGVPPGTAHAAGALGLLDLGLGRYEAALSRLSDVVAGSRRQGSLGSLPDLVEAAVRAGTPERGREAAAWYRDWAARIRRPWAEAIALRCAALLATGAGEADQAFARAVELHRRDAASSPFERARTELLYGEWLRRSRRRNDARPLLHSALDAFERLGAEPWAERARTELRAAGESVAEPDGTAGALASLTPQELQVVRLAASGLSNREIGAQLFLSPRTVGYHLYKVYPKLGVASRGELARLDLASA
ncbi:helix-turn-helix transcriptional regulator [Actinomadura rugatobispora]|uniref:AAA family ATPase n=1 Tax=Actinomadura rugatobispora TaxID=1994 RepID=A0ABW1A5X7_9ACTN